MLLALPLSTMAQTVITYSYDSAGNRNKRSPSAEVASTNNSIVLKVSKIPESDTGEIIVDKDKRLAANNDHSFKFDLEYGQISVSLGKSQRNEWKQVVYQLWSKSVKTMFTQSINKTQKQI